MNHAAPCVVVAELIPSHGKDCMALAREVARACTSLKEQWPGTWLEAPCQSESGLGISAVLPTCSRAFDFAVALNLAAWPQRFRVHANHTTRELAHKALANSKAAFSVDLQGLQPTQARVIETATQLHAAMMHDWKPSRAKAAKAMRAANNQNEAAARLGIRQQSVSEALRAGHAKELVACESAIRAQLETLLLTD
jgi:hypothetical protein